MLRRTYWYIVYDVSENMNSLIFWDVTPYLLVYSCRHFGAYKLLKFLECYAVPTGI